MSTLSASLELVARHLRTSEGLGRPIAASHSEVLAAAIDALFLKALELEKIEREFKAAQLDKVVVDLTAGLQPRRSIELTADQKADPKIVIFRGARVDWVDGARP